MWIAIWVVCVAAAMFVIERRFPARPLPRVRGWWGRVALLNFAQAGAVGLAGLAWDPWFVAHRPWSSDNLGDLCGPLVGYLTVTLVYYFWHRARHASPIWFFTVMAPVVHTAAHWPQLTHFVSASLRSKAGMTCKLLPR